MARLRYNGLTATLGADLLTAGTTITFTSALQHAAGTVPTITGTDYIPLSVLADDGTVLEIVHLTAYTSGATTGTVTRAQESTSAADQPSGSTVVNGPTAADLAKLPTIDVVTDHGAKVDGTTDDTAAWQAAINAAAAAGGGRIISSRSGVSIIAGALQDTSGANAQILLPAVDAPDSEQITIAIEGATPPPPVFSVVGAAATPDNHLVLKSTIAGTAGGAVIGGRGPVGTYENFTNLLVQLKNLTVRLPSNPVLTGLNLAQVTCVDIDNVIVDCGNYHIQGLTEPTTSSSYGIRLPASNNGAYTRLGAVAVCGFYTGYQFTEHTVGQQVNAWGCKRAFEFNATNHASKFQRMMTVHCPVGMVFTGTHYVDVDQFNVEHADAGWWVTTADIDDPSNVGHGQVTWHVVLANVGIDGTFTKNGGSGITTTRVGSAATTGAGESSWTAPTLQNSWANYGGGFANAGYRKDGSGVVHLRGLVQSGAAGSTIFTLPVGYRPASTLIFSVAANGAYGQINVLTDGSVTHTLGSTANIALDQISFYGDA